MGPGGAFAGAVEVTDGDAFTAPYTVALAPDGTVLAAGQGVAAGLRIRAGATPAA